MMGKVLATWAFEAAWIVVWMTGCAAGVRATEEKRHAPTVRRHAVCIRPTDVAPTPGSATLTSGLQDQSLLDHMGQDSPLVGYAHTHRLKVIRQTYIPGGTHHPHHHERAEQVYYILSGKARVRLGEEVFEVEGGTVLYIPPMTEHQIWNIGDAPLVNLLIDVTLDEGEELE